MHSAKVIYFYETISLFDKKFANVARTPYFCSVIIKPIVK